MLQQLTLEIGNQQIAETVMTLITAQTSFAEKNDS